MNRVARRSKACESCRAKKIKCDEVQPECLRCRRAGKVCPGPVRGNIFVNAGTLTNGAPQGRKKIQRSIHGDEPHQSEQDLGHTKAGPSSQSSLPTRSASLSSSQSICQEVEAVKETANQNTDGRIVLRRFIGDGRSDPFSTFARRTSVRENYLIDVYVRNIITIFGVNADVSLHPQRDICFPLIIEGTAAMEAMFAYVAAWLSRKLILPENEAKMYQAMAVRRITSAISDPSQQLLSSTLMAILGCINIIYQLKDGDFLPEEKQQLDAHIRGIRYLIDRRGGYIATCNDPSISWITVTTDLMTFGEISAGGTPLSPHLHASPTTGSMLTASVGEWNPRSGPYTYDSEVLLHEYSGAFRNFFQEAQTRGEKCLSMAPEDHGYYLISRLFRPGIHIHRLLTNPICIGYSLASVLFFLNDILWDNRDDLSLLFNGYFKRLRHTIVDASLDLGGSNDFLLWILISEPRTHRIENFERVWLVARLLRIHKRLSAHVQAQVEHSLLHFILTEDGVGNSPFSPDTFQS